LAGKGVELASAYISLSISTKNIPRQVREAMAGVQDIDIDVDAKTGGATANMARWRTGEERRPVRVKVDVDTKGASRQVGGLRRDIESLARSDFLKLNIGAAGIASLPALATGLGEVAAALTQVSQAALAVPGGIAGAVSSIGTLAFGLTGISDAYDAVSKASDEAATSGGDVAAQARAQLSASNSLRNAVVDETQARKDVARATRDARNELMDLNIEMRGGVISEKRAVLEAQKAREDLMSGRFTDLRDQLLRVEEADQRVLETRARNAQTQEEMADANAKGVANSDQVVAANERLVRSQQGVAEAQAAVAATAPKATAAQEDAALALSKLHPEAQALVETMHELAKGPGIDLRNMVAGNILEGVSDQLRGLATKAMPTFERGLGRIGKSWNKNINEVFEVLGDDDSLSLLDRIFGNTAEAQDRMSEAIDPLVEGLGTLVAAGTDVLPRLADGLTGVSERFADFITKADEDGRLDTWINEGIDALGHLGETALNVGKMFTAITRASDGTFLANLEKWTTQWQEFLNSPEGQEKLKNLFAEGKETFNDFKRILEDLPGILKGVYDAADTYIGGLIDVLDPVTSFLKEHPKLVEAAAYAYIAFKGARVLGSIAALASSLTGISNQLGRPGRGGRGGSGILGQLGLLGAAGLGGAALATDDQGLSALGTVGSGALAGASIAGVPGFLAGTAAGGGLAIWNAFQDQAANRPTPQGMADGSGFPFTPGQVNPPGSGIPGRNPLDVSAGRDARGFAHGEMMPFWQSQGFAVGDHAADKYGEHQNGALDIMVDSIEDGNKVLEQVLKDPNVYGAIFNNQAYGYGQGAEPRPYSGGFTGNPTQDHQDHVHAWYKPGGDNNIAQMPDTLPPQLGPPSQPPTQAAAQQPGSIDDFWQRMFGTPTTYDEGGWWPSGTTGINTTGKPEYVLTPQDLEWLNQQGIDPNSVMPHSGSGQPPGPGQPPMPGSPVGPMAADAAVNLDQFGFGSQPGDMEGINRTQGYTPAGAGYSGKTGGGLAGSLIQLGADAAKGAVDVAADLGKMAASAAITAGTFGAGAAAGPAAGMGIDILAGIAKRGIDYGAELGGIGVGALTEILMPFGAPRWLTDVDATSFMPQIGIVPAALTAAEQNGQGFSAAVDPATTQHGQAAGAPPGPPGVPPPPADPMAPPPPPAPPAPAPAIEPPAPATPDLTNPSTWMSSLFGVFDSGGVLQPNGGAINLSNRPEYVFTQSQFKAMEANAANGGERGNTTYQVYGQDLNEALRELKKVERRNSGPAMRNKAGL